MVTKSTVPAGTNRKVEGWIRNAKPKAPFDVASNPEFLREAPLLSIAPARVGGGAKVRVVGPQGRREGETLLPGVKGMYDPYDAAREADLSVILTGWNEFCALDLERLRQSMRTLRLANRRNTSSPADVTQAGIGVHNAVGR